MVRHLIALCLICVSSIVLFGVKPAEDFGNAEDVLAGIKVGSSLSEVEHKYGQPTSICDEKEKDLPGVGERTYAWMLNGTKLEVHETYYHDASNQEQSDGISSIEIWGNVGVDEISKTGRGLALGQTEKDIKTIYGFAPVVGVYAQMRWKRGAVLDIDFDKHTRRINHMELRLEQE